MVRGRDARRSRHTHFSSRRPTSSQIQRFTRDFTTTDCHRVTSVLLIKSGESRIEFSNASPVIDLSLRFDTTELAIHSRHRSLASHANRPTYFYHLLIPRAIKPRAITIIHCLRSLATIERIHATRVLQSRRLLPLLLPVSSFFFPRDFGRATEKPHRTTLTTDRIREVRTARDSRRGPMDEGAACRSVRG